jgi:hypothetical protein
MTPKNLYLALSVAGIVVPYSQFVPFVREHGLDLGLFIDQLFATRVSAFFALDVIVSAVVLWTFVVVEGPRRGVKRLWMPIAASLVVGVSLALPLFLYLREARAEN